MHNRIDRPKPGPAALVCTLLCLVGCGAQEPLKPGRVAKEWAATLRELQMTPVFPPREDVQVGDIYTVPVEPKDEAKVFASKGYLPRGIWVHSLDLNEAVSKFYQSRSDFPPISIERLLLTDEVVTDARYRTIIEKYEEYIEILRASHPQPELPEGGDTFKSGNVRRLRLVGFPEFMSATMNKGDLSAFLPTNGGSFAAQASFSDVKSVTVKIPVAESYGLPFSAMLPELIKQTGPDATELGSPLTLIGNLVPKDRRRFVMDEKTGLPKYQTVRLRVATEVFYARVVDIGIRGAKESGGALRFVEDVLVGQSSDPPPGDAGQPATGPDKDQAEAELTPEQRAARIEARIARLRAQQGNIPGGSIQLLSVSQNSIGMRRIYDRPVAIGFRGFDLIATLDAETGELVKITLGSVTESSIPKGN